jgi:hypothetical protein
MMWLSNNKQYLFDDPSKHTHILKIIGKDQLQAFQKFKLDTMEVPDEALTQIADTITQAPDMPDAMITDVMSQVSVPKHPVILNPEETNPEKYDIKPKLDLQEGGEEADLYITPDDFEGEFEYIPDVTSMAVGANQQMKESKQNAIALITNPAIQQMLMAEGLSLKVKELLISIFSDAGMKDAESLFQPLNANQQPGQQPGQGAPQAGANIGGPQGPAGMGQVPPAVPNAGGNGGIPGPQGLPIQ